MQDSNPADLPPDAPAPAPPCRFLRSKGMYVYTDADHEAEREEQGYDNTNYWCSRSLRDIGPDHGFVSRSECRDPARECYQPL